MKRAVTFYLPKCDVGNWQLHIAQKKGIVFKTAYEEAVSLSISSTGHDETVIEQATARAIADGFKYKTLPVGAVAEVDGKMYYNNLFGLIPFNVEDLGGIQDEPKFTLGAEVYLNRHYEPLPLDRVFTMSLPRWSECAIFGEHLHPEVADEIIRRTDSFINGSTSLSGGNAHEYNEYANELLGKSSFTSDPPDGLTDEEYRAFYAKQAEDRKAWREKWGSVDLNYLAPEWASCSYIGGPNGWIRPGGTIAYHKNVGKYAYLEYLFKDLARIAENFPEVHMIVTLGDGEYCESDTESIISFEVKHGIVSAIPPIPMAEAVRIASCEGDFPIMEDTDGMIAMAGCGKEGIISTEHIKRWAEKVFGKNSKK